MSNAVRAMRPDSETKRKSAGPERPGNPGLARIGNEGFVRASGPEEVTKRVRAARRAESHEGPGVNRGLRPCGPKPTIEHNAVIIHGRCGTQVVMSYLSQIEMS
jgi:hypothetical protein